MRIYTCNEINGFGFLESPNEKATIPNDFDESQSIGESVFVCISNVALTLEQIGCVRIVNKFKSAPLFLRRNCIVSQRRKLANISSDFVCKAIIITIIGENFHNVIPIKWANSSSSCRRRTILHISCWTCIICQSTRIFFIVVVFFSRSLYSESIFDSFFPFRNMLQYLHFFITTTVHVRSVTSILCAVFMHLFRSLWVLWFVVIVHGFFLFSFCELTDERTLLFSHHYPPFEICIKLTRFESTEWASVVFTFFSLYFLFQFLSRMVVFIDSC